MVGGYPPQENYESVDEAMAGQGFGGPGFSGPGFGGQSMGAQSVGGRSVGGYNSPPPPIPGGRPPVPPVAGMDVVERLSYLLTILTLLSTYFAYLLFGDLNDFANRPHFKAFPQPMYRNDGMCNIRVSFF